MAGSPLVLILAGVLVLVGLAIIGLAIMLATKKPRQ